MAIGQSFSAALEDRAVAEAGVDMWIQQYPALIELTQSNTFFVSMATTIGKRKLLQAPWGLAAKVGGGAFLSLLNVATDIYTIYNFLREEKFGFAYATMGMLSFVIFSLLLLVYQQNRTKGAKTMFIEVMIVISFTKPAVGAYRVVSGE